ncbi:MAG: imidazole glycerol phosphate synthase subunit HisH [Gammaproteobacteria bacterium]
MSESIKKSLGNVLIVDYGMGNLHSVAKAVVRVAPECDVIVSQDPSELVKADRVILPGVGAIRDCMSALTEGGWVQALREAWSRVPFLGICVGMQMLLETSEENEGATGLGWFPGQVVNMARDPSVVGQGLKVPHMGWNQVEQSMAHPIWSGIPDGSRFYFVHSFAVPYVAAMAAEASVLGRVDYGRSWVCALAHENVVAVQFHPEKSAQAGLTLLRNFMQWRP